MNALLTSIEKPQLKNKTFLLYVNSHASLNRQKSKGYRCESDMSHYKLSVTSNCVPGLLMKVLKKKQFL